jgi:SHS2 domain-containing protein
MSHEILPHPADVKLRASGESLTDAFAEVVVAISEIVAESSGEEGEKTESRSTDDGTEPWRTEVDLSARDLEGLLFDFLDEIIYRQDADDVVITRATNLSVEDELDGYSLSGLLCGRPIPTAQPRFDIKAPTYSGMVIERRGDEWVIEAVLDI